MIGRIRWAALAALLILTVSPILAQATAPLTQSSQITGGGFTVSISYPADWVETSNEQTLFVASSASALQELQQGLIKTPGQEGVVAYLPGFLDNLKLPYNAAPMQVIAGYLQTAHLNGTPNANSDLAEQAATALVAAGPGETALLGALAFPTGTVVFGATPSDGTIDAITKAIINSITLTGGSSSGNTNGGLDGLASTEVSSAASTLTPMTPTTLDLDTLLGKYQLTISLPDGWVTDDGQDGTIHVANSPDELKHMADGSDMSPGDVGMLVFLPLTAKSLGVNNGGSPEDAVKSVETTLQVSGDVVTDSGFSVPAAHALVNGSSVPKEGGVVYALKFDTGILVVLIQPASALDASLTAVLQSITYIPSAATPEATAAIELPAATETEVAPVTASAQWAVSADGSSEYGDDDWSFMQATGKPDTTTCDDNGTAWASANSSTREYLRVTFAHPVIPSQINIYQTYNPGAIVEVDLGNSANPDKVLPLPHSADPAGNTDCPGVFSVDVTGVDTPIDFVVLYIDQTITGNWDEIDAVQLIGAPVS